MNKTIDETGNRYGKLVVLERSDNKGTGACWLCKCDCGAEKIVLGTNLRAKLIRGCGCIQGARKYSRKDSTWQHLYSAHKQNHNKWGALPFDDWKLIVQMPCSNCGLEAPERMSPNGDPVHAHGIDRIDSTKGYIPGNVQPMCSDCNYAKSDSTQEQFNTWIERVARFKGFTTNGGYY